MSMDYTLGSDLEWQKLGLCAQTDPEVFFPEYASDAAVARRICLKCDVRTKCLNWAIETREEWGIWGGLTTGERNKLRRFGTDSEVLARVAAKVAEKEAKKANKWKRVS